MVGEVVCRTGASPSPAKGQVAREALLLGRTRSTTSTASAVNSESREQIAEKLMGEREQSHNRSRPWGPLE